MLGCSQAVRPRVLVPLSWVRILAAQPSFCGSRSVVEYHLAKVEVAGSNPVFRLNLFPIYIMSIFCRHSQVVRPRSAKLLSSVQIRLPPFLCIFSSD